MVAMFGDSSSFESGYQLCMGEIGKLWRGAGGNKPRAGIAHGLHGPHTTQALRPHARKDRFLVFLLPLIFSQRPTPSVRTISQALQI